MSNGIKPGTYESRIYNKLQHENCSLLEILFYLQNRKIKARDLRLLLDDMINKGLIKKHKISLCGITVYCSVDFNPETLEVLTEEGFRQILLDQKEQLLSDIKTIEERLNGITNT